MTLQALSIQDLRCIERADLRPAPGLNVIHGTNGSGKTTVLEAVFLLGRGRSFRTRHTERLIRHGAASLMTYGEALDLQSEGRRRRIGISYSRSGEMQLHVDGLPARSRAELPAAMFVEVIDPEIHRLVEGAPAERRRWLDWSVFHVEPQYFLHWTRFVRVLKQRNAALRARQNPTAWNKEFALQGEVVARLRQRTFELLRTTTQRLITTLADLPLELSYRSGWREECSLEEALHLALERDVARGSTTTGPQRCDIELQVHGRAAKDVLSRGQQKLVAAAFVLAAVQYLRQHNGVAPTLLLDDPAAELDAERIDVFSELIRSLDCQLLITSLQPTTALFGEPQAVFHVEQGRVKQL